MNFPPFPCFSFNTFILFKHCGYKAVHNTQLQSFIYDWISDVQCQHPSPVPISYHQYPQFPSHHPDVCEKMSGLDIFPLTKNSGKPKATVFE